MNKLCSFLLPGAALFFTTGAAAQTVAADTVKTATVKVINLHCDGDMPTIQKRLLNEEGVDEVQFTGRSGSSSVFTIRYHSAATDQPRLESAIEATPGCDDQHETPYRVKHERTKTKR